MLDLEDELRATLRSRTESVRASGELEARIARRLHAKQRARRITAAALAAAVIAGAALTTGALVARGRNDNSIHTISPPVTGSPSPSPQPQPQPTTPTPVPLQVARGHWGKIAEPPLTGAYAAVWGDGLLFVAFRIPNVQLAAYDPRLNEWAHISAPPIELLADFSGDTTLTYAPGVGLFVWAYENHGTDTFSGHHRLLVYNPETHRWKRLADPPIATLIQARPIWTGRELIVWGGNFNGEFAPAEGLAYDPTTNRWRHLPAAPLSTRENPSIVWTGHEMIVWGGLTATKPDRYQGAAYDPDTNSWRPLPANGLPNMELAAAVWTGTEMIVFGSPSADGTELDGGAAYNPATGQWRAIATTPLSQREEMASAWTGHELVVWGGRSPTTGASLADGAAYDPATNRWRMLTAAPIGPRFQAAMAWTEEAGLAVVVGGIADAISTPPDEARGAAAYRP